LVSNRLFVAGINRRTPIPRYYQIMEQLRSKIQEGAFAVGSALPPERELAEAYNVSRMTVRQAITGLVDEGILIRRQGVGTFVAPPKLEQVLSKLTSFTEDMALRGMKAGARVISFAETAPSPAAGKALGLDAEEDRVYQCTRLRLADEEPMALETTEVIAAICPGLCAEDLEDRSLYELLSKRWGVRLDHATQSIEPALPTLREATLLHIPSGAPVLLMHRITYDQNDRAIEYVRSIYRGDRYKFIIELRRR